MLTATLLALGSAFLHAGWNLVAKRSDDPLLALSSQFLLAGGACAALLAIVGGMPSGAWPFAAASGLFHIPYIAALSWAYRHGDFSLAYPVARGGGALLGALGGLVLLGDRLSTLGTAAIVAIAGGMMMLSWGAPRRQVAAALVVATAIGGYTLADAHAMREYDSGWYVLATHMMTAIASLATLTALGRVRDLTTRHRRDWLRSAVAAAMTVAAYAMVLVALRRAPVGYVSALRESSVLIAVVAGSRLLGEGRVRVRLSAALVVVLGLVTLVAAR